LSGKGGKKLKRGKKTRDDGEKTKRELIYREDGQGIMMKI
jgi:hypothetical protein